MARSVGGSVNRRRTLTPPELQRACFSEMVRHVQVSRKGQTRAPSRYLLRLNPIDMDVVDDGRGWFTDGLVDALRTAARENGWALEGPIDIAYEADPSRRPGVPAASAVVPDDATDSPPSGPAPASKRVSPGPSAAGRARLVLRRTDTGEAISLGDEPITIGRSHDRTITIADDRVSRSHARIERGPSGWTVTDEGSSNGTRVGGEELAAGVPRVLRRGDVIGIGPVDLHVEAAPGPAPESGARALDDQTRTRISGEVLRPKRDDE